MSRGTWSICQEFRALPSVDKRTKPRYRQGVVLLALFWLRLLTLPPEPATRAGAAMAGRADLADELVAICRREAPGDRCDTPIGAHAPDLGRAAAMYRNAAAKGWVGTCALNTATGERDRERFGVRGVHGLSAAYSLWHLQPCLAPEALDVPFLSAVTAARRATYQCEARHLRACTREARHRLWVGAAKYDRQVARGLRKPRR